MGWTGPSPAPISLCFCAFLSSYCGHEFGAETLHWETGKKTHEWCKWGDLEMEWAAVQGRGPMYACCEVIFWPSFQETFRNPPNHWYFPKPWSSIPWSFSKSQGKPPKKEHQGRFTLPNPENPGKPAENSQNTEEFPWFKKDQGNPKHQKMEDQGKHCRYKWEAYCGTTRSRIAVQIGGVLRCFLFFEAEKPARHSVTNTGCTAVQIGGVLPVLLRQVVRVGGLETVPKFALFQKLLHRTLQDSRSSRIGITENCSFSKFLSQLLFSPCPTY